MAKLLLKINGELNLPITSSVNLKDKVVGELNNTTYIDYINFKVFLQDFSKINEIIELDKNISYGFINNKIKTNIIINY